MTISISRPRKGDSKQLRALFSTTITDAFQADGIGKRSDAILEEIEKQMSFLREDFDTGGKTTFFLVARLRSKLVGTVSIRDARKNENYSKHFKKDFKEIPEISSVYILPKYQRRGIGSLLFNSALLCLLQRKVKSFCLDGGYRKSQSYWISKLGAPNKILKDHFGKGLDYMMWIRNIRDIPIEF